MDNVTHSLIGYALGRATTRTRSSAEQRAGIWASIAASNAPDLDFIAGLVSNHAKLSYLSHHRGHTHTLLLAVPIGIACAELFLRLCRVTEAGARVRLYTLGALAGLLHIGFDSLNNYGVHPFFPLDNRWYYGDAVFIIEPFLFAALLPLLTLDGLTRYGRGVGAFLCVAILALVWGISLVPTASAVASTAALALALVMQRVVMKRKPGGTAWHALGAAVAAVVLFAGARALADNAFSKHLRARVPDEQVQQLVLTPLPANPLCWSAVAVTTDLADTYRARFGFMSLLPAIAPLESCRAAPRGVTTAPLVRRGLPPTSAYEPADDVRFDMTFEGKLKDLRALAEKSCEARVLLQFARAPYWIDGPPTIIGDLRYDHEPELQFAEIEPHDACSDGPVPWVPPLQSLLR